MLLLTLRHMLPQLLQEVKKLGAVKKTKYIVLVLAALLTVAALAFSFLTLIQKNGYISEIKAQLENAELENRRLNEENEQLNSEKEQLSSEKEQLNSEKEKLSDELEAEKNKKSALEKENSKLKKEIEKLKNEHKTEETAKNAVNSVSSASPAENQPSGSKICYLTFDDGPSDNTLKILEILKKYNVKATFFVINTENISYVRKISDDGHTIGLHSASHNYSQIYKSSEAYFSDLNKISSLVFSYTGEYSKLIRFPGGSSNSVSAKYCKGIMTKLASEVTQKGYCYFDWNVSSEDATSNTVSFTKIVNSVLNGAENKNNICVLMHDSSAKTTTVDALPMIIEGLSERGFSFMALSCESPGFKHGITN